MLANNMERPDAQTEHALRLRLCTSGRRPDAVLGFSGYLCEVFAVSSTEGGKCLQRFSRMVTPSVSIATVLVMFALASAFCPVVYSALSLCLGAGAKTCLLTQPHSSLMPRAAFEMRIQITCEGATTKSSWTSPESAGFSLDKERDVV